MAAVFNGAVGRFCFLYGAVEYVAGVRVPEDWVGRTVVGIRNEYLPQEVPAGDREPIDFTGDAARMQQNSDAFGGQHPTYRRQLPGDFVPAPMATVDGQVYQNIVENMQNLRDAGQRYPASRVVQSKSGARFGAGGAAGRGSSSRQQEVQRYSAWGAAGNPFLLQEQHQQGNFNYWPQPRRTPAPLAVPEHHARIGGQLILRPPPPAAHMIAPDVGPMVAASPESSPPPTVPQEQVTPRRPPALLLHHHQIPYPFPAVAQIEQQQTPLRPVVDVRGIQRHLGRQAPRHVPLAVQQPFLHHPPAPVADVVVPSPILNRDQAAAPPDNAGNEVPAAPEDTSAQQEQPAALTEDEHQQVMNTPPVPSGLRGTTSTDPAHGSSAAVPKPPANVAEDHRVVVGRNAVTREPVYGWGAQSRVALQNASGRQSSGEQQLSSTTTTTSRDIPAQEAQPQRALVAARQQSRFLDHRENNHAHAAGAQLRPAAAAQPRVILQDLRPVLLRPPASMAPQPALPTLGAHPELVPEINFHRTPVRGAVAPTGASRSRFPGANNYPGDHYAGGALFPRAAPALPGFPGGAHGPVSREEVVGHNRQVYQHQHNVAPWWLPAPYPVQQHQGVGFSPSGVAAPMAAAAPAGRRLAPDGAEWLFPVQPAGATDLVPALPIHSHFHPAPLFRPPPRMDD
ncbi:unnamed protein product [Amoebophrya sp. A120]|nr:unnamed protein product [Amoebophrya sp. A120]|eukprot:GSA120T00007796001.1